MAALSRILVIVIAAGCLALEANADTPSRNQDILNAIQEIHNTKHFTFIMLINMAPVNLLQENITFLMPSDESLSRRSIHNVTDFLMRHTIPSPMLFNHLCYIPTDSIIPSLHPAYALRVSNYGRPSFFLNNARVNSPNLCTFGMSVRCHGIDDVLSFDSGTSITSCLNNDSSLISLPSPLIPPQPAPVVTVLTAPAVGPEAAPALDDHTHLSKSSHGNIWTTANSIAFVALTTLLVFSK